MTFSHRIISLPGEHGSRLRPVNVASVPQRSPFRYPGGKTWLIPWVRRWLKSREKPEALVEPFLGGGVVSLTAAFENLANQVMMVELDEQVAAVWRVLLSEEGTRLAERIRGFSMTPEAITAALESPAEEVGEQAFQVLLKNRIHHGGILAAGSGRIKSGENGKGIRSRWYPETLQKRILDIQTIRSKLQFTHGDGLEALRNYSSQPRFPFFIDPPYTAAGKKAGKRLYTHSALDHEELFRIAQSLEGDFLMTYDNAEGARRLAERFGLDTEAIPMKNTHHAEMTELLIGRDLNWARRPVTMPVSG